MTESGARRITTANMAVPPQRLESLVPPRSAAASTRIWSTLPRELASMFRPRAADVAVAVVQEIRRSIPEYARLLEGPFGPIVTGGVEEAIAQFIDRLADPSAPREDRAKLFRHLGKLEVAQGRSVDTLQSAYRIGARVAWRRIAEFGQSVNLPTVTICQLAEAVFDYVDEISVLSLEGFAAAQAKAAGALDRRRRRLLELLLSDPPVPAQTVTDLAATARWTVPDHVVAVALERGEGDHDLPSFDDSVLEDFDAAEPCLVMAADNDHLPSLHEQLPGWRAVVGPRVRLSEASTSLRLARRTLTYVHRGLIQDAPVVWSDDHLSTLWLLTDEFLARELAERTLRPLAGLTVKQRARLGETLLAWLETSGSAPEIAGMLNVHPQTVRYRLHQLEALFGDRLTDPDDRFRMEISLRAMRLLEPH
ncbi:helix-turn-helix domain-containing protein [Kibdelosporangium persicum]|uniref:DNA-binding PucR family transcriptional regulator n=1 Tax=Kibdelosporangium persicum TaxID=2698649 RepID=A0ABX2EW91_9PSEU|nr:helix-turn-helix domain-containing protein [Kibdelosporangium persicum]NRN63013.1 DNA-binding PucR family transcriptional regulator [Kibdelosporangium persicum]